ncbi:MAG: hypothetical protein KAW40_02370, partial [Candidatus Aenigmarchaeota archaeon]|nr:hypothetical protein [Candidatus Aenigmarchaeota archaeon]
LRDFLDKSERNLLKEGVRSHIAKSISKNFVILKSKDVEKMIERNREFAVFLRKYFERGL